MTNSSLTESLARLYRLHAFGVKFGLETELALLDRLGHPERGLNVIHVAGTNGKGSVSAMLDAVLQAMGLKTGLYTSPHLIRFNERIRVNGQCITDDELADLIRTVDDGARSVAAQPGGREVTFFEFATALAFEYFKRRQVDIAVLETGMGGRLDATNVITPLVSVITRISLEHTAFLGRDLSGIAREKGGIIKPGRPVIVGPMAAECLDVLQRLAREQQARLIKSEQTVSITRLKHDLAGQKINIASTANSYGALTLPLAGSFQVENTALAVAALEELAAQSGKDLPIQAVKSGLENIRWPGRFQVITPTPPVIVDGAHNQDSATALAQSLRDLLPGMPMGLVLGMCSDKDIDGFLRPFSGLIQRCWAVALKNERSLSPTNVAAKVKAMHWPVTMVTVPRALEESATWARKNSGGVVVTGSLFLAGEALELKMGADLFAAHGSSLPRATRNRKPPPSGRL